jgi:hypothetical protein
LGEKISSPVLARRLFYTQGEQNASNYFARMLILSPFPVFYSTQLTAYQTSPCRHDQLSMNVPRHFIHVVIDETTHPVLGDEAYLHSPVQRADARLLAWWKNAAGPQAVDVHQQFSGEGMHGWGCGWNGRAVG